LAHCRAFAWTVEELDALSANRPMTAKQAATLKQLVEAAYEVEAFEPNLTRAEADLRCTHKSRLELVAMTAVPPEANIRTYGGPATAPKTEVGRRTDEPC
jgi:hypothetical protein